jgi:DNA polymerase-1
LPESKRCVLIDGHSLAYRAYYALPADLATSAGQLTNAVYGFTSMLIKVLEEFKPQSVIVAFDRGKPEFRTEVFEDYKAHRKPMPDELREQMDIIHAVLEALGIPIIEEEGYEADDVLATLTAVLPEDEEVLIVTGDRDALQLVNERVRVVANRRGITDIIVYDPEEVSRKYGVDPGQILDYLALKGDASDNIPGVPGIGEKTAASLISEYGSLDGVYDHIGEMKAGKIRKALEENRESAYLSRDLARMRSDVPIPQEGGTGWSLQPWDEGEVQRVFDSLEFRKLYGRLKELKPFIFPHEEKDASGEGGLQPSRSISIDSRAELEELLGSCQTAGELSLYAHLEGEGYTRGDMDAVTAAVGGAAYRFNLCDEAGRDHLQEFLHEIEARKEWRINVFRGKDIMVQCAGLFGVYPSFDFDVELASYLVNPSGAKHDLESSVPRYLGQSLVEKPSGQLDLIQEEQARAEEDGERAYAVERLVPYLETEMNNRELRALFEDIEMPLQVVLAEMEIRGVRLDTGFLSEMQEKLQDEIAALEEQAYELAGESFNLNSPQQLSQILFEVLGLQPIKRTKTGFATDVSVLTALREQHPIADVLLRYRELSKLLNTYVSALPRLVDPTTGRLHASFNQAVTATGRLSSSNPNLQNIPIRTPLGKNIRKAFLPTSDSGLIVAADYSQIELRVLAHLSGDEGLRTAFEEDLDIHASTAAEVFDIPFDEVNADHRRKAKAINFGIIYGISAFGLSEQLGIEREEAEEYIEEYFRQYPGVRKFLDRQVEEATLKGYVTTLLGRRREIPELAQGNVRMRRLGERLAFNTPIQGSAADIIKVAMLHVHHALQEGEYGSRMILQVHDELVFDVEKHEVEEVQEIVRREMEGAYDLDVALKVDIGTGPTWYDVK